LPWERSDFSWAEFQWDMTAQINPSRRRITQSADDRLQEMKSPSYTLAFLLLVVTIVAVFLGAWRLWPMSEGISEAQAQAITIQMTEAEVEAIAGLPHELSAFGRSATWVYKVAAPLGTEPKRLVLTFGEGRLSGIRR
jgi:hypothetical protein